MTHTDKQPQTVFVPRHPVENKRGIRSLGLHSDVVHDFDGYYYIKENVYLFSPAELEEMKSDHERQLREAVEKAFDMLHYTVGGPNGHSYQSHAKENLLKKILSNQQPKK